MLARFLQEMGLAVCRVAEEDTSGEAQRCPSPALNCTRQAGCEELTIPTLRTYCLRARGAGPGLLWAAGLATILPWTTGSLFTKRGHSS